MATKLSWDYQNDGKNADESIATIQRNGETYRIRAVLDDDARNPFTDDDCNWPIIVRSPDTFRKLRAYEFGKEVAFRIDTGMLKDEALVHNQHAICRAIDVDHFTLLDTKYERDACRLRDLLDEMLLDRSDSETLETLASLYEIAGWPCYRTTVTGYCQGDWAEVLVVATKEARDKFGCKDVKAEDLKSTAELYGHWAWGTVYGYIVEKRDPEVEDEDDDFAWEEIPDGSCWGYYGPDFDESGLEESALECVPDEEKVDA